MKPGIRRLIEELRGARVLVVHPRDAEGDALLDQLKRIGCKRARHMAAASGIAQRRRHGFSFGGDRRDAGFHRIRFGRRTDLRGDRRLREPDGAAAASRQQCPRRHQQADPSFGILSSLVLARSMRGYTRRLESKVQKLEETLKARRDVDKAVKILVTLKRVSEAEAYELIRSQATQKRLSMAEVATTIIGAQDVMAGLGLIDER